MRYSRRRLFYCGRSTFFFDPAAIRKRYCQFRTTFNRNISRSGRPFCHRRIYSMAASARRKRQQQLLFAPGCRRPCINGDRHGPGYCQRSFARPNSPGPAYFLLPKTTSERSFTYGQNVSRTPSQRGIRQGARYTIVVSRKPSSRQRKKPSRFSSSVKRLGVYRSTNISPSFPPVTGHRCRAKLANPCPELSDKCFRLGVAS